MRRSIRAIRAARWSISRAIWSASIPRSSRARAARSASALPFRPTWRRTVAEAGENGGKLVRPWFGARLQEVTTDIADSLNIDPPHGALITEVAPDSPAAKAGLKSGDVDHRDRRRRRRRSRRASTSASPPSRSARPPTLTYVRGGKTGDAERRRSRRHRAAAATDGDDHRQHPLCRHDGRDADAGAGAGLNLPFDSQGRGGDRVAPGSPADQMGLQQGDIIVSLNGSRSTMSGRSRRWSRRGRDGWQIVLQRDGQMIQSYISG